MRVSNGAGGGGGIGVCWYRCLFFAAAMAPLCLSLDSSFPLLPGLQPLSASKAKGSLTSFFLFLFFFFFLMTHKL